MQGLVRPVHGGLGWQHPGVEDFSSNLNPYGPPEGLMESFAEALPHLVHYPDDRSTVFREAICSRFHVNDGNVTVGAGSAEIIRLFPDVFLSPGDRVVMPSPTFSEYSFACQVRGASIDAVPLPDDLRVDIDEMMRTQQGGEVGLPVQSQQPHRRHRPAQKGIGAGGGVRKARDAGLPRRDLARTGGRLQGHHLPRGGRHPTTICSSSVPSPNASPYPAYASATRWEVKAS